MDKHDEIKSLLSASRKLLTNQQISESVNEIKKSYGLITEEEYETALSSSGDDVVNKINVAKSVEDEIDDETKYSKESKDKKQQKYRISGGLLVLHGNNDINLELTTDEKSAFQETMDEFVNEVSDLVDFEQLNVYTDTVEWSGKIIDFDIEFFYSLGETNGVYINGDMMKIDDNFLSVINKLKKYYDKFKSKWAKILATRKKTKPEQK
jgi:hypothetical protein